jgi:hypothetical protein
MSVPGDGDKVPQTGLVDMGDIGFYGDNITPIQPFTLSDLDSFTGNIATGSISEMVLNVTWAQLQPTQGGALTTTAIDDAINLVNKYNEANGTTLGLKLRVWGGYTAPLWAQNIDGPPITINGQRAVDPDNYESQTLGRFWTADYIAAWTSFQNALALAYDGNEVIRGISNTAGAAATDEPFVPLSGAAPISSAPQAPTVNQIAQTQAAGYTDAAQMLTLRAAIADYSQWATTPLDYTMNLFHLQDSGKTSASENFTLAVLQQARNSTRLVQAGNHALNNPLPSSDAFIYYQMAADAALDPAATPGSYQTAAPNNLKKNASQGSFPSWGDYADWPNAIANGVAANAGDIELWDSNTGFLGLSPSQLAFLAATLAAGVPPTTSAPDDGSPLDFIAPAFVTGAPGAIAFSGTNAVLLASTADNAFALTLTSLQGGTLGVTDFYGIVIGPTHGATLSLLGTLPEVNTVLASLTDTLQSGRDVVQVSATNLIGTTVVRDVGVQVSQTGGSSGAGSAGVASSTGTLDSAEQLNGGSILVVGGVQNATVIAGNLEIGGLGNSAMLLAALAPSAYSTASLSIGGALDILSGGTAHFSGALGANTITIDSGGAISGNGTLAASGGGAILNDGTIEAAADTTLGLQQLTVASPLSGSGALIIDPAATLILGYAVGPNQAIQFAQNSIAQFANTPYSPSTLVLLSPDGMKGTISGFSFADSLVLSGITATGVGYSGSTLTVSESSGTHIFTLTGDLAGLTPVFSVAAPGTPAQTTITFVTQTSVGLLPGVVAPPTLSGAVGTPVSVPDVILLMPFPAAPPSDMTVTVKVTAGAGELTAVDGVGLITFGSTITLTGTLGQVERSLQTLTYEGSAAGTDTIVILVEDYAGAGVGAITVYNEAASQTFAWVPASGSFSDPGNWSVGTTPPGGNDIASFGPGTYSVSGDGAVGEILATGTLTLTGQVIAQGSSGVALVVDSGGALTLAGGAVLSAQAQATVGDTGQGLLALMGGALALTGPSAANALVIGEESGSSGTVVNLEQITALGTVVVGGKGNGTLELLGVAASLYDGAADIGQSAGSQGSVIVNGGFWASGQSTPEDTTSGQLTVGDSGIGSLLINGMDGGIAGQVTAFNATIGNNVGSVGSITLDGGELLVANYSATSSTLIVGESGVGSLMIEDGSEVAVGAAQAIMADDNGLLVVGGGAGGNGRIRITGNSTLLVYGDGTVGGEGVGDVAVGQSADDTASFALTGSLAVDTTGHVSLSGSHATLRASEFDVAVGGTVSGAGTLSGLRGGNDTVKLASIDNDGSIMADGGNLLLYGTVTGTGVLLVSSDSTLTLQAAVGQEQIVAFSPNAHVVLNDPTAFEGTIAGFGKGDVLELASIDATSATFANHALTLDTATGPLVLNFAENYSANAFTVQSDGLGGTNVTLTSGGGWGDVHMTTFDGLHYDFQAVGEFVAVRSTTPGNPWQIQIRTQAFYDAASITTELAAALGDARVTFAAGDGANSVRIDGAPDAALHSGVVQNFASGTLAQLSANAYELTWKTGESVSITNQGDWLDWSVALGPNHAPGSVQGLLGGHSGQASDFQLPDGTVLAQPLSNEEILGPFADAWRVAHGSSLWDPASVF